MATMTQIETTTLAQIGGAKAMYMIGGTVYTGHGKPELQVKFKARALSGINYLKIALKGDDTYTVTLSRVTIKGENVKLSLTGVYADQLVEIFERHTGLYLSV